MTSPAGHQRTARALRGGVVATTATGVALASHVAGGGAVPGLLGVLVPWAVSLWLCTLVAGRRPARRRTIVSVTASQVAFHTLFVLGTPTGAVADGTGHGAHAHHGTPLTLPAPSGATVDLVRADATMWLWHAAAAAATAALLFHGEVLLARLRRLAGAVVAWFVPRPAPHLPCAPHTARHAVAVAAPRGAALGPQLSPLRRRGPPLLAV